WLGLEWDDGPVRQSERQNRYREAAAPLGSRFEGITLLREDGSATYQLASVVDDIDFAITHVVRGNDHRPNEPLHQRLHAALGALADEELAARAGVPVSAVPLVRGAHDLVEARAIADAVLNPPSDKVSLGEKGRSTLERFRELRERANGVVDYETAKSLLRELKAVGGDLRALRLALTGREKGPELAAVVAALDRDETLRRIDAAL